MKKAKLISIPLIFCFTLSNTSLSMSPQKKRAGFFHRWLKKHKTLRTIFTDSKNRKRLLKLAPCLLVPRLVSVLGLIGISKAMSGSRNILWWSTLLMQHPFAKIPLFVGAYCLIDKPVCKFYYSESRYDKAKADLGRAIKDGDLVEIERCRSFISNYERRAKEWGLYKRYKDDKREIEEKRIDV